MNARITEAELADVERALLPALSYAKGVTEGEANLARGVQRYIAEVRRLRALIADWHSPEHDEKRLWPALEDEARAITRGEAMPDRITDAELALMSFTVDPKRAQLVVEVRRLRALIVGVAGVFVGGPGQCIACHHTLPDHRSDCDAAPVVAEARAIREEEG
jgi:hypothetical protein